MTYRQFEIYPGGWYGWAYVHEDYDGAPDANDHRCGDEKTIQACKEAIDTY
jgi:hypothetical protein